MVKQIKILLAFLRLIRLPNLAIIAITQYFIRWFILKPLLVTAGFMLFCFAVAAVATAWDMYNYKNK